MLFWFLFALAAGMPLLGRVIGKGKLLLSFLMLAGRLEIYPVLVLFSPHVWKKN